MRRHSFLWKLFLGFSLVVIVTTALMQVFVSRRIESDGLAQIASDLRTRSHFLAELALPALRGGDEDALRRRVIQLGRRTGTRLTVIAVDGRVLADSDENPARMEPHGTRPEILEARESGEGRATRYSETIQKRMMYYALSLEEGDSLLGYARSSLPMDRVEIQVSALGRTVFVGTVLGLLATLMASGFIARRITRPLAGMVGTVRAFSAGDYARRAAASGRDEFGELATAFNTMARQQQERLAKISEERNKLEAILTGMVEGVVAVHRDDRVLHMNGVAAGLLGIARERAQGRKLWELSPPPAILEIVEACREEGRSVEREIRRDGMEGERIIEVYASPLPADSNGAAGGAILVLHDTTELRRLERVRRDFVANVSHELKTPLTVIRGMVETMEDDAEMPADTRARFLARMRTQAEYLTAQVADLLAISRFEGGDQPMAREPVDLVRLASEIVSMRATGAEDRGLRFHAELPSNPVTITGDPLAIGQALGNLIDNALHYTPEGGSVTLSLDLMEGQARFSVTDTGIGIEPEHIERIFERFYRADKARSREQGGTGLGLAIVKHVVSAHGGEVHVESKPGRGSTFSFTLPLPS